MNTTTKHTLISSAIKAKYYILYIGMFLNSFSSFALNDVLKMKVTGNNYSDETVIRFLNDATPEFDGNYDAWKLFSMNPNVPSLYTQIDSVSQLSINAYPSLTTSFSFSLYCKIPVTGNYTFRSFELGSFGPSISILMEDLQTGNYYNLRDTAHTHTFNMTANTLNSPARFIIHFSPALTTGVTEQINNTPGLTVFQSGNEIVMKPYHVTSTSQTGIQVFSLVGTELFAIQKESEENDLFTFTPAMSGIYIVNFFTGNALVSKKIFFTK